MSDGCIPGVALELDENQLHRRTTLRNFCTLNVNIVTRAGNHGKTVTV